MPDPMGGNHATVATRFRPGAFGIPRTAESAHRDEKGRNMVRFVTKTAQVLARRADN
jgi:hypothetical protein